MTTAVNPVSSVSNVSASTGNPSSALSDANASQDRFLKLLVAQLNNQDPMNPMDNAQMTSQMAQINTVSGIQQLNETMKSMSSQFTASRVLQGTAMIGHDVLVQSDTLSVDGGKAKGSVDVSGNADKVTLEILSPGGQVVDTRNLGAMTGGRHSFEWDASNYAGGGSPSFRLTAVSGGKNVPTTAMARDTVVSINSGGVDLKGRASVAYDAILSVL
nr:flagellar hook capping FlgD N-terminal domain-containing protein [Rhodoferax sp.]